MLIPHTLLVPHLPTLMLDERRGHRGGMVGALREASTRLLAESPEVVVVFDARWTTPGAFLVDDGARHRTITDDPGFGVDVRYDCAGEPALAKALVRAGAEARVRVTATTRGVDSGIAVPLTFLVPGRGLPVVPLSVADQPAHECRSWGAALRRALAAWPRRAAFVVSGLLSFHRHAWTFRRDVPGGHGFDERTLEALRLGAWGSLAALDEGAAEHAHAEAGLRHLEVLRGYLGRDVKGEVRCYEASPGAGAALIEFADPATAPEVGPA